VGDIYSILSSNYKTVGSIVNVSRTPYVAVDPKIFEGTWRGTYSTKEKFSVSVSNVVGFRGKAKYQSGNTVKYQDILIKDNAFRIGDSKFTVTKPGVAQVKTVVAHGDGTSELNTAYAHQAT
jgi:hypothetical protein